MSKLNLRKEIREALPVIDCDLCGGYKPTDDEVEKFVELFKQWALELLPEKKNLPKKGLKRRRYERERHSRYKYANK